MSAIGADTGRTDGRTMVVERHQRKGVLQQEQVASPNAVAAPSAAKIEQAPDQNLADALARLPDVTVFNGGQGATNGVVTDIAGCGQGNTVVLRGPDAEYNIYHARSAIDGCRSRLRACGHH